MEKHAYNLQLNLDPNEWGAPEIYNTLSVLFTLFGKNAKKILSSLREMYPDPAEYEKIKSQINQFSECVTPAKRAGRPKKKEISNESNN